MPPKKKRSFARKALVTTGVVVGIGGSAYVGGGEIAKGVAGMQKAPVSVRRVAQKALEKKYVMPFRQAKKEAGRLMGRYSRDAFLRVLGGLFGAVAASRALGRRSKRRTVKGKAVTESSTASSATMPTKLRNVGTYAGAAIGLYAPITTITVVSLAKILMTLSPAAKAELLKRLDRTQSGSPAPKIITKKPAKTPFPKAPVRVLKNTTPRKVPSKK